MRYRLTSYQDDGIRRAMVETWDCEIVKATPAFLHFVGQHITMLHYWCDKNDWHIKLTNEAAYPGLMGLPENKTIVRKVVS